MKAAIAVFARAPVPGQVKTRLARHIGNEAAAELYAAMLHDSLKLARPTAAGIETVLAYTPEDAFTDGPHSLQRFWQGPQVAQSQGKLGQRMLNCIAQLQARGAQRIVIIGSDSPDLPTHYIQLALWRLHKHPMVFGPTRDGGFYLIGASVSLQSGLFNGVEWSSPLALGCCLEAARRHGIRANLIPPWDDVDTLDDVSALLERLENGVSHAPKTLAWLRSKKLL